MRTVTASSWAFQVPSHSNRLKKVVTPLNAHGIVEQIEETINQHKPHDPDINITISG
jgi:hypothetical protein